MALISQYAFNKYWYAVKAVLGSNTLKKHLFSPPKLSYSDINSGLKALPINIGDDVMIHSSLSAFGYIEGGAETVIKACQNLVGTKGNILMPSFSLFEHRQGVFGSWWNVETSSVYTGAVSEVFWKKPEVTRSNHPTHSVAVLGPRAGDYTLSHSVEGDRPSFWGSGAFSSLSPWQKMIDYDLHYVMFGCGFGPATLCHHVESYIAWQDLEGLPREEKIGFINALRHNYYHPDGAWPDINRVKLGQVLQNLDEVNSVALGWSKIQHVRAKSYFKIAIQQCRNNEDEWLSPDYLRWKRRVQLRKKQLGLQT